MTTTDDRPGVEERYLKASATSNLRVQADRRSDADVLIAAGWSAKGLGGALLRLASEWDAAAKPKPLNAAVVAALAQQMRKKGKEPDMAAAQREANAWFENEMHLFRIKLKSLTATLEYIVEAMHKLGMASPSARAGAIVGYWLHQACHACHGLKFETIQSTPVLSAVRCKACHGTGLGWAPHGADGRRMLNLMDDSVSRAREGIKGRLRQYHK